MDLGHLSKFSYSSVNLGSQMDTSTLGIFLKKLGNRPHFILLFPAAKLHNKVGLSNAIEYYESQETPFGSQKRIFKSWLSKS